MLSERRSHMSSLINFDSICLKLLWCLTGGDESEPPAAERGADAKRFEDSAHGGEQDEVEIE